MKKLRHWKYRKNKVKKSTGKMTLKKIKPVSK